MKVIFKHNVKRMVGELTAIVQVKEEIIPMSQVYLHANGMISDWHCVDEHGNFGGSTASINPADVEIRVL